MITRLRANQNSTTAAGGVWVVSGCSDHNCRQGSLVERTCTRAVSGALERCEGKRSGKFHGPRRRVKAHGGSRGAAGTAFKETVISCIQ